jgi:hypothetical protein
MILKKIGLIFFFAGLFSVSAVQANSSNILEEQLTVKSLAKLSDEELFQLIQNRGLNESCLPEGKSVGQPGRIYEEAIQRENLVKIFFKNLMLFLGQSNSTEVAKLLWSGKTFKQSEASCEHGTGTNQVLGLKLFTLTNSILTREFYLDDENRYQDQSELAFGKALENNKNKVNLVELNYARSQKDLFGAGKKFGVRDIMVPIQNKDGSIIYIGRAYTGKWISEENFKSSGLVAWFFLDFNKEVRK